MSCSHLRRILHTFISNNNDNSNNKKKKFRKLLTSTSRALKKTIFYSISGNIKFGFSDGSQPLPVEKIQSKWDLENVPRAALELNSTQLDDVVPTSKAVSWPKVRN